MFPPCPHHVVDELKRFGYRPRDRQTMLVDDAQQRAHRSAGDEGAMHRSRAFCLVGRPFVRLEVFAYRLRRAESFFAYRLSARAPRKWWYGQRCKPSGSQRLDLFLRGFG